MLMIETPLSGKETSSQDMYDMQRRLGTKEESNRDSGSPKRIDRGNLAARRRGLKSPAVGTVEVDHRMDDG